MTFFGTFLFTIVIITITETTRESVKVVAIVFCPEGVTVVGAKKKLFRKFKVPIFRSSEKIFVNRIFIVSSRNFQVKGVTSSGFILTPSRGP